MQKSVVVLSVTLALMAAMVVFPNAVHGQGISSDHVSKFRAMAKMTTSDKIIQTADANRDGKLSLQEAAQYATKYGVTISAEELKPYDLNQDGFFSIDEIDAVKNGR